MKSYKSLDQFINVLEGYLDESAELNAIESATDICSSDVVERLSLDEWDEINYIISEGRLLDNAHKQDIYIHDNLAALGYTNDEIEDLLASIGR